MWLTVFSVKSINRVFPADMQNIRIALQVNAVLILGIFVAESLTTAPLFPTMFTVHGKPQAARFAVKITRICLLNRIDFLDRSVTKMR